MVDKNKSYRGKKKKKKIPYNTRYLHKPTEHWKIISSQYGWF